MGCGGSKADGDRSRTVSGRPPTAQAQRRLANITRYTEPESIWAALMAGHVRLVKMSWLIAQSKMKRILARRQELPEEAFISIEELKRMYGDGNDDGVLPIIAISFCWLTPQHPDPEGKQLATVAAAMEEAVPSDVPYGLIYLILSSCTPFRVRCGRLRRVEKLPTSPLSDVAAMPATERRETPGVRIMRRLWRLERRAKA